jgi:hypothetical protein
MRIIIKNRRPLVIFGAVFCLLNILVSGQNFSLGGYYKNFFVVLDPSELMRSAGSSFSDRLIGLVNNQLRLQAAVDLSHGIRLSAAYALSPRIQDPILFNEDLFLVNVDAYGYRAADLNARMYPQEKGGTESFAVFQNLDRMVLSLATGPADIYIGRQAIAWGSARVINPIDIIAPFALQELDKEERVGVDAVRVRIPWGFMGEFDVGYVFGKDSCFKNSAFFIRAKNYIKKTDVSLILLGFRRNLLVGFDLARSIGGAGFWMEGGYVIADFFMDRKFGESGGYFRLSTGLDYSLSNKTYGFLEYHFNSGGSGQPKNYLTNQSNLALSEGAVFLLGRHYLIQGINYQITPLISLTAEVLLNLSDGSLFTAPVVEYNLSQNVYISAGGFLGLGKEPVQSRLIPQFITIRSEFGSYSNAVYTSFRVYF